MDQMLCCFDQEDEADFRKVITGFVDFYDQRVKDELSYFTEKFESAIDTLCSFMALKKKEDLLQTIATLINFDNKHSQYIS